jgi:hypothetical protein
MRLDTGTEVGVRFIAEVFGRDSYSVRTGVISLGIGWQEPETDFSPKPSYKFKNARSVAFISHIDPTPSRRGPYALMLSEERNVRLYSSLRPFYIGYEVEIRNYKYNISYTFRLCKVKHQ